MPKTTVHLDEGYRTTIKNRKHIWWIDEPVEDGGTDTAATPMETVMGALGGCVAITMKMYAKRKGWALDSVDIVLDTERLKKSDFQGYEGESNFVHRVTKQIVLHGDLTDEQRQRLIEIGMKCPVSRLISEPAFIVDQLLEAEIE